MPENSDPGPSTPGASPISAIPAVPDAAAPGAASTPLPTAGPPPPPAGPPLPPRIRWWLWREQNVIFPRSTLLLVVTVGVVGAFCWRPADLGVGLTITGVVALAAVLWAAPSDFRARLSSYWIVVTVGIVGLLLVPAFRASGWLSAFCLFAAVVAAATLFVEARGIRGLWLAALSPFFAPFVALGAMFRRPPRVKPAGTRPSILLIGVVATTTVVLLLVFGALFASADASFGSLFSFDVSTDIGPAIGAAAFSGLFITLATLAGILLVTQGTTYPDRPRPAVPIWAWAIPVGALLAMFLLFLGVQATALFGGDDFVRRTANLTYSQYAVQGFWQLLIVGILVIGVTVTAWHFVDADDARSRQVARILLGGLCVATLAVGASAIHRMTGYIKSYGMTEDRIFGIFVELLVGIVIVGFLIAGARMNTADISRRSARPANLTRSIVVAGLFATLAFALFNPERYIASYNLDRYESTGKLDAYYLGGLSADAASEFNRLPTKLRDCVDWRYARNHETEQSWRAFTFARYEPAPAGSGYYYQTDCVRAETYR